MDLPIACTLSEAEFRQRRQTTIDAFRRMQVGRAELPDGYAYTFEATSEALLQIAQLVDMERECCPFLTFKIMVDAGRGPIRLEVTGPKEAKALIADYLNFDSA